MVCTLLGGCKKKSFPLLFSATFDFFFFSWKAKWIRRFARPLRWCGRICPPSASPPYQWVRDVWPLPVNDRFPNFFVPEKPFVFKFRFFFPELSQHVSTLYGLLIVLPTRSVQRGISPFFSFGMPSLSRSWLVTAQAISLNHPSVRVLSESRQLFFLFYAHFRNIALDNLFLISV